MTLIRAVDVRRRWYLKSLVMPKIRFSCNCFAIEKTCALFLDQKNNLKPFFFWCLILNTNFVVLVFFFRLWFEYFISMMLTKLIYLRYINFDIWDEINIFCSVYVYAQWGLLKCQWKKILKTANRSIWFERYQVVENFYGVVLRLPRQPHNLV